MMGEEEDKDARIKSRCAWVAQQPREEEASEGTSKKEGWWGEIQPDVFGGVGKTKQERRFANRSQPPACKTPQAAGAGSFAVIHGASELQPGENPCPASFVWSNLNTLNGELFQPSGPLRGGFHCRSRAVGLLEGFRCPPLLSKKKVKKKKLFTPLTKNVIALATQQLGLLGI